MWPRPSSLADKLKERQSRLSSISPRRTRTEHYLEQVSNVPFFPCCNSPIEIQPYGRYCDEIFRKKNFGKRNWQFRVELRLIFHAGWEQSRWRGLTNPPFIPKYIYFAKNGSKCMKKCHQHCNRCCSVMDDQKRSWIVWQEGSEVRKLVKGILNENVISLLNFQII